MGQDYQPPILLIQINNLQITLADTPSAISINPYMFKLKIILIYLIITDIKN